MTVHIIKNGGNSMNRYVVVWQQEMEDGEIKILDTTFNSYEEVEKHIKLLKEDAITLNKPFKLLSVNDLSNNKIHSNKAHMGRKMKGKGSGWKGESRRHSLARKGIRTK